MFSFPQRKEESGKTASEIKEVQGVVFLSWKIVNSYWTRLSKTVRCRICERYFVKVEVYTPGSVLIKARNRNHESCPSSVVERTGVERFHA